LGWGYNLAMKNALKIILFLLNILIIIPLLTVDIYLIQENEMISSDYLTIIFVFFVNLTIIYCIFLFYKTIKYNNLFKLYLGLCFLMVINILLAFPVVFTGLSQL